MPVQKYEDLSDQSFGTKSYYTRLFSWCDSSIARGNVLCWISFSLIHKKESPSESNTVRSRLVKEDTAYIKAFDRRHFKLITKKIFLVEMCNESTVSVIDCPVKWLKVFHENIACDGNTFALVNFGKIQFSSLSVLRKTVICHWLSYWEWWLSFNSSYKTIQRRAKFPFVTIKERKDSLRKPVVLTFSPKSLAQKKKVKKSVDSILGVTLKTPRVFNNKNIIFAKRKHEFRKSEACVTFELDSDHDLVCSTQIDKIFSCQGLTINEKDQRGFNKQSCFWKRFSSFRKEQNESPVAHRNINKGDKILSLVPDG